MKKIQWSVLLRLLVILLACPFILPLQARTSPAIDPSPNVKDALGTRNDGSNRTANYSTWLGRKIKYTGVYLLWSTDQMNRITEMFDYFTGDKGVCSGLTKSEQNTVVISMPMVPQNLPNAKSGAGKTVKNLQRGISGEWDKYYRSIGQRIAQRKLGTFWSDGRPKMVLRLGWEHTGDWYAWSSMGAEAEYKALFRHIVQVVESAAGTKVVWEWNGSNNGDRAQILKAYPGDDVVDIVGIDFYDGNYGSVPKLPIVRSEAEADASWYKVLNGAGAGSTKGKAGLEWYREFAQAHGKLIGVSEWGLLIQNKNGAWIGGGDDVQFIQHMFCWFSYLAKNNGLAYLSYFETNHGGSSPLQHKLSPGKAMTPIKVKPGVTTGSLFPNAAAKYIELFGGPNKLAASASLPTVTLASPVDGAVYNAKGTITLYANVTGAPLQVDFYNGSTYLGTVRKTPYSLDQKNVKNGNYSYTARATYKNGDVVTSKVAKVQVITNSAPKVTLTSPKAGDTLTAPTDVLITANASDSTGSVVKVEFYNGTKLIGTSTQAPYSMVWKNVAAGTYSLKAKATDGGKMTGTSTVVKITVKSIKGNTAPSVSISSPSEGDVIPSGSNLTISADASDSNGISQVLFYEGGTLLGTDTTAPYSYTWKKVSVGTYSVTAVAVDSIGSVKYSKAVQFSVKAQAANQAPVISISSSSASATLQAPANATVNASATDSDGSISKVEFYDGKTLVGSDVTSPYSVNLKNLETGIHVISAIATDNQGAETTSNTIQLTVQNTAPVVSITSPTNAQTFTSLASITITGEASDANGSIANVQFYRGSTLLGSDSTSPYSMVWKNVGSGTYSISLKAIDNEGAITSSSVVKITVNDPVVNKPPVISISATGSIEALQAPAAVTIKATASDPDGSVSKVEFFDGKSLMATDTTVPYSVNLKNLGTGSHSISAKATDDQGAEATSEVINLNVQNTPPVIALTRPSSSQSFTAPATITISADASDSNGSIANVEFYRGTTLLGSDDTSPYSMAWKNVGPGTYNITAKATDNEGAVTTTDVVSITVKEALLAPADPTDLTLSGITSTRMNLSWVDHSNNETGFLVERKTGSGGFTQIATVNADVTVFGDTGLTPGTQYSYRVRANNGVGNSIYSNTVDGTTLNQSPVINTNPSSTVSGEVNSYISYQITASDHPTVFGAAGLPAGMSLDPGTGLISGVIDTVGIYPISITASNDAGTGMAMIFIVVQPGSLAAPTNLNANSFGAAVLLSWTDNSNDETSFRIWRREGTDGPWIYHATVRGATSYLDRKDIVAGKTYYYHVRARKGESDAPSDIRLFSDWSRLARRTLP